MREMTTVEIEREVAMMSDTMNWPHMFLPVKRLDGSNRVGIILHSASYPYDVFECNMFVMDKCVITPLREGSEPDCPVHHYKSFQEIVEDGWIGD